MSANRSRDGNHSVKTRDIDRIPIFTLIFTFVYVAVILRDIRMKGVAQ